MYRQSSRQPLTPCKHPPVLSEQATPRSEPAGRRSISRRQLRLLTFDRGDERLNPSASEPWDASKLLAPAPVTGLGTLAQIQVLVSAADEEHRLRKIASEAFVRINHMLVQVYNARILLNEWNYQLDPAREVRPGHLADRSLQAVERSELVIAIVGRSVGQIAKQEVLHHYKLKGLGLAPRTLWLFAHKPRPRTAHYLPLADLVKEVKESYGEEIVYKEVGSELDFQASLMLQLLPYALARAGLVSIPLEGLAQ